MYFEKELDSSKIKIMYHIYNSKMFLFLYIPLLMLFTSCPTSGDVEKKAAKILANLKIDSAMSIDSILTKVANHYDLPGITATVTRLDSLIEVGIYGVSNTRSGDQLSSDKCFDINSISKAFSTLIIMQLKEENRLSLQDKLTSIFPELVNTIHDDYNVVTINDFLKHQSGMSRNARHIAKSHRPTFTGTLKERREQFTLWILQQESNKTVGEFSYSNAGFVIVGAIIERVTGNLFEVEVQQRIFDPLGMKSAGFGWPVENANEYTYGHLRNNNRAEPVRYADWYLYGLENPSGGIHLSITDLTKFTREHMLGLMGRSKLLSQNGFISMHKIEDLCGLGWYESIFKSYPGTEVGGTDDGYRSEIFISKENHVGITVLTNINDMNDWIACKVVELALLNKHIPSK
jgi:CubicO group peptidase (beta-lactamase class C family)